MGTLKRESVATQASLRSPPQETATVALSLYLSVSIKPVFQVLMTKSYFTTGIALRLALRASVSQTLADPRSYAKGQTTTEIVETIKDIYDVDISSSLVSRVTDNILDDITAWQNRPLSSVYPIVYLDCIVVKVRQDKQIINKAIYLALGVGLDGRKELLGMWLSENEGAKFWLGVLTELQNRGVQDILIACVDGLKGFPDAINAIFPNTEVQLCVIHQIRNSIRYVASRDQKAFMRDLKPVYKAVNKESAELALDDLEAVWGDQYPAVIKSWRDKWHLLSAYFKYPEAVRKPIYTTNAVEAVHRQFRKLTKTKGAFPNETSLLKLLYVGMLNASAKWTMPIRNWGQTMMQLSIYFPGRLDSVMRL